MKNKDITLLMIVLVIAAILLCISGNEQATW